VAQTLPRVSAAPIAKPRRRAPWPVEFYRSAVGKKWSMALSGIILMGFVIAHLIGNLKLYLGRGEIDLYGEALRNMPGHLLPRTVLLWTIRIVLIAAFAVHIQAAVALTRMNQKARTTRYQSPRDYVAATYASRTMRWSGVIVILYLIFHLMDLTWGVANPQFVRGDPYNNLIFSMQRPVVAIVYGVANVALGLHLWHGAWSMFQSLGINNPRINAFRRWFARSFAAVIVLGNLSFPILIQAHVLEPTCSANRTPKTTQMCPTNTLPGGSSSSASAAAKG
jgi:succinate dehydrogenase / fumarate reductase cytochrome b subunit